jgi:hypothetical protein
MMLLRYRESATVGRFLLVLTFVVFSGWSQPVQPQTQPPIVVQVQMPPTNPWVHLLELVIPGIIGAGLALFGVWVTNRSNASTNAANRQHQLDVEVKKAEIATQAKSRDNRWEFRKTVYVKLLADLEEMVALNFVALDCLSKGQTIFSSDYTQKYNAAIKQFSISANLAPLAASDKILPLVKSVLGRLKGLGDPALPNSTDLLTKTNQIYLDLREQLQAAGHEDLWGTPDPEVKA